MRDIQSTIDNRHVYIDQVGISDFEIPVQFDLKPNCIKNSVANVKFTVALDEEKRAIHMSRMIEVLTEWDKIINFNSLVELLHKINQRLDAKSSFIQLDFDLLIEKSSPVSKVKGFVAYKVSLSGTSDKPNIITRIKVPITTVCPCSKAISERGAHNQRGEVNISIIIDNFNDILDVINIIEKKAGSEELFSVLKRIDEKFVTEHAYDNPKFVEDVIRDAIINLKDKYKVLEIEIKNYESIHNHNAYAYIGRDKKGDKK
ncbi:GTP cyclohydrolase FolE2 [Sporolactobacillus shoreicorticis]|uniref:GTP cyclohydrolase FolE2 n=1 Tax=Sporolactobacillus shoreicorticis TaxID=1923877 RepID=A0ABW5S128_9BACL|nr:GTP cyclohydrolase FolE2 [Sporolactobacillus shoreicorticis]MCO7127526.1 GTP cyclohydrolase FolE2 [Sporolactobacillus shoreicorticis]